MYQGRRWTKKKMPSSFYTKEAENDRKYGDNYEKIFQKKVENWCECKFDNGISGWERIDFKGIDKKIAIELKTRRINKWDFNDIMISKNKIKHAIKLLHKGYKVFFFWKFKDELCFYDLPKRLPSCIREDLGGTTKRGYDERAKCYFIPTSLLKNFKEFNTYKDYMETIN